MSQSIEITLELEAKIVASIRAGGYPIVAAQAWGVSKEMLERWLSRGRRKKAREPYRRFARNVDQALGQARLRAEMDAFKDDSKNWLKHGPGKELPGQPGWSALAKSTSTTEDKPTSLFAHPEVLHLLARVREVLGKYPEALTDLDQLTRGAGF